MSNENEPIFVGSTRPDLGITIPPLGLFLVIFAILTIQSLLGGSPNLILISSLIGFSAILFFVVVRIINAWRYEFYEDHIVVKHEATLETYNYSDVAAWSAARFTNWNTYFRNATFKISISGMMKEIALTYVPYNRRLRMYLSDFLDKKIPEKRVKGLVTW